MNYVPMMLIDRMRTDLSIPIDQSLGDANIESMQQLGCPITEDMTSEGLLDFVTSFKFFSKDCDDPTWFAFNHWAIVNSAMLMKMTNISLEDVASHKISLITEWRDLIISPIILDKWAKHKQVYKLDRDFAKALINTDKIRFTKGIMDHLPNNTFYIDLTDADLPDTHGILVYVDPREDHCRLNTYTLTYDGVFFSHYLTFNWLDGEETTIEHDVSKWSNQKAEVKESALNDIVKERFGQEYRHEYNINRKDMAVLVIQLLTYLGSESPQITESARTKNTYKPNKYGSRIKNKWSEVQMWDVGLTYGSEFRKQLKALKEQNVDVDTDFSYENHTHKSPRPHLRRAHWHRYRYGKNHAFLSQPVWQKPIFVGANGCEMPVTIHKVIPEE